MMRRLWFAAVVILLMAVSSAGVETKPYGSFKVTVTFPYRLSSAWTAIPLGWNRAGTASAAACTWTKFSLKSIAGGTSIGETTIDHVKRFFSSHGVVAAGGLAMAGPGGFGQFRSLDYTDPKDRDLVQRMSALTARHFDEIILDDFFFINTKSDSDIAAKGKRTWQEFRLELMDEVSRDLILKPAKDANPYVHVIIKYPNWYPSFQGLGYDLEREPQIFPEIWTGDETRDPEITDRQLHQYESYEVFSLPGERGAGTQWRRMGGSLQRALPGSLC